MRIAAKKLAYGLRLVTFTLAGSVAQFHPYAVTAQERWPFASLPESLVGMTTGTLQPANTYLSYIGSAQTSAASTEGSTGRQVYFGGLRYRGEGPWQIGASIAIFDDVPAAEINGSLDSLTYVGAGLELKYQLYETTGLSAALLMGVEAAYFSRGFGLTSQSSAASDSKDRFTASTLSLPVTYQINDQIWATAEVGYTHAAATVVGGAGFGGRAFTSTGLAHKVSERLFTYGAVKALWRPSDSAIDAPEQGSHHYLYTIGGQFALTPQSALNVYITNAFSPTPIGDDFGFFPDKTAPVFGARLAYIPSGPGVGEGAATFYPATRSQELGTRYADGFTIKAPHTLASDTVHTRLSYGWGGQSALSLFYTTEPDFQFEFTVADYALASGSDFRSEAQEDLRFEVGGRWQAMDEAYGQPFNLGFDISAGRDFKKPSIGTLFVAATASKTFDWGEVTVNARRGIYASEAISGVGLSLSHGLSDSITAIGEFTAVLDDRPVWALGLRHSAPNLPFAIDLYTTNAAGLSGIGSLLSNDRPQVCIALHWEGGIDLL